MEWEVLEAVAAVAVAVVCKYIPTSRPSTKTVRKQRKIKGKPVAEGTNGKRREKKDLGECDTGVQPSLTTIPQQKC